MGTNLDHAGRVVNPTVAVSDEDVDSESVRNKVEEKAMRG